MSAAFAMGAVAAPRAFAEPPPAPVDDPALSAVEAVRVARADAARAYDKIDAAIIAVRDAGAELLPCVQLSTMRDYENGEPVIRPIMARSHAEIDAFYSCQRDHVGMFGRKALEGLHARKAAHHAALDAEIERLQPIHEAAGYITARDEVESCEEHATDTFSAAMTTEPRSPAGTYALWQLLSEELGEHLEDGSSSLFEGMDILDKALRTFLGVSKPRLHDA
ncbi:MAG: hypothetical protein KF899_04200 [Parvibaculum sp.]|nr:hypothetical protein [Parvibaculum sp.]